MICMPVAVFVLWFELCEATCCKGFLQQLLTEHYRRGGDNPKVTTRAQLLEDGVPIRSGPKAQLVATEISQCGTFTKHLADANRKRKSQGVVLNRAEYNDWVRDDVKRRWVADSAVRASALSAVRMSANDKRVTAEDNDGIDGDDRAAPDAGIYSNIVELCGDTRSPFVSDYFDMVVKKMVGVADDDRMPGHTSYEKQFRAEQLEQLWVADEGLRWRPAQLKTYAYGIISGIRYQVCSGCAICQTGRSSHFPPKAIC